MPLRVLRQTSLAAWPLRVVVLVLLSLVVPAVKPQQQVPGLPGTQPSHNKPDSPGIDEDPYKAEREAHMEKTRESERHKKIAADTARLVQLTNELKAAVDKSTKDELSLDVVRKAAEIEKHAHEVKELMKGD